MARSSAQHQDGAAEGGREGSRMSKIGALIRITTALLLLTLTTPAQAQQASIFRDRARRVTGSASTAAVASRYLIRWITCA